MSSAAAELTHNHTQTRGLFSQSHFMVLLLPIYGNQSRKQMLQTAFQKHPEKCKQRLVSACFGGKDRSANYTGVSTGRQHADVFYAYGMHFLRKALTPINTIFFKEGVLISIIIATGKPKLNSKRNTIR